MASFEKIFRFIGRNIADGLSRVEEDVEHAVERKVRRIERYLLREMITLVVLGLAFAFLALAVLFGMVDYLHINRTASLLVVGILILIIGIALKLTK